MFCQAGFDQWLTTIMHHLSPLSKPQATVLALWSFGMVLARSCALTAVSHLLAKGLKRKEQPVRQQLREWYYDVPRKRGTKRQLTINGLPAYTYHHDPAGVVLCDDVNGWFAVRPL